MVKCRAKLDAQGNPLRHDNGRFVKGDRIGFSVMEKRTGWHAEYPPDIRKGEWDFQEFKADRKPNDKINLVACLQCHRSQAKTFSSRSARSCLRSNPTRARARY
jgi:hypothetical protein